MVSGKDRVSRDYCLSKVSKSLIYVAENMGEDKGKQEFPKLSLLIQKIGRVTTVQLLFRMICIIYL